MFSKIQRQSGFFAALDQSGGSTPKALREYGVDDSKWSGETEMFDRVHEMRARVMTSPSFSGQRVLGAILFEQTMDRDVAGKNTCKYLWEEKGVVPILKVDKGLQDERDGVQLMKDFPGLEELLDRAVARDVFGTKMSSVIKHPDAAGIKAIVDQQFEWGKRIMAKGLVPILEPEVDIKSPGKAECETALLKQLLAGLEQLDEGMRVIFKLTIPSQANLYKPLILHPKCVRVVALSGGYSGAEACKLLAQNEKMIASFSRAFLENLKFEQSDDDFDKTLDTNIQNAFTASCT